MIVKSILDERYAVSLLVELSNNGPMKISDFLEFISNYRTLDTLTDKLEKSGLIQKIGGVDRYGTTMLSITEKGQNVSKQLSKALKQL